MIKDEDWYDAVGKDRWIDEQFELSEKYPEYLGKWILVDFEGSVTKVSDEAFPFAKLVKYNLQTLPIGHPDWERPLF
jgi:hypothetical protein